MNDRTRDDIGAAARSRFERAVDALPAGTGNRLRLARRAALASRPPGLGAVWALPLGTAAALLLGIAWWRQAPAPAPSTTDPAAAGAQSPARVHPAADSAAVIDAGPSDAGAIPALANAPSEDEADLYAWIADTPVARDARDDAL